MMLPSSIITRLFEEKGNAFSQSLSCRFGCGIYEAAREMAAKLDSRRESKAFSCCRVFLCQDTLSTSLAWVLAALITGPPVRGQGGVISSQLSEQGRGEIRLAVAKSGM
ncbi:hypothetical protein MHYP_G00287630 [Metynnis hypsauchen]